MKYIDEYRNARLARGILSALERLSAKIGRRVTVMEICGSHTHAIARFGLRQQIPPLISLISGPGCPVCVTSAADMDRILSLAERDGVVTATFGDMMKVPGTGGNSLQHLRAMGAKIEIVSSARDALDLAPADSDRQVVFLGIGFETTAPTVAAAIRACRGRGIANFSVLSLHKTMPQAIQALIDDPALNVDGFLCPGHVSTITGTAAYAMIPRAGRAAVITGFEPLDILEGLAMLLKQIAEGSYDVAIQYGRGVQTEGNPRAREVMKEVFQEADAEWRGLGLIRRSGLTIRDEYRDYDAAWRFAIPDPPGEEPKDCRCGDILKGVRSPADCPLFGRTCIPSNPIGPCMVSSEGTCAAYYTYHLRG